MSDNLARDRKNPLLDETEFHGLVTSDASMLRVFELTKRVAQFDTPVLIRGESGTGKEGIARAIHANSPRKGNHFAPINCATLRPELAASTLFGHVRGAFTGAVEDRQGLFEAANRGTVFLDEIAELPSDVQAQLLRVLQEQKFSPVGSAKEFESDARLIGATLRSLRDAVAERSFREDLMYRVRVVVIYLPPLIDRGHDLELHIWRSIDRFNASMDRNVDRIKADAFDALRSYHWPGNIRELQNAIEHAFIMAESDVIELENLPMEIRGEGPPTRRDGPLSEKEQIRRALLEFDTREEAAGVLGMSRSTLWRKIKEYQLD